MKTVFKHHLPSLLKELRSSWIQVQDFFSFIDLRYNKTHELKMWIHIFKCSNYLSAHIHLAAKEGSELRLNPFKWTNISIYWPMLVKLFVWIKKKKTTKNHPPKKWQQISSLELQTWVKQGLLERVSDWATKAGHYFDYYFFFIISKLWTVRAGFAKVIVKHWDAIVIKAQEIRGDRYFHFTWTKYVQHNKNWVIVS